MKIGLVYINGKVQFAHLNREMLEKEFTLTTDLKEADLIMVWNTVPEYCDPKKTILFQIESPLTSHRKWTHHNFDKFFLVGTFNPDPSKKNQIKLTENPVVFPYNSRSDYDKIRENTKITDRIVFYAGRRDDKYDIIIDEFNTQCLYLTRHKMVDAVTEKYPQVKVHGKGWDKCIKNGISTKTVYELHGNWRLAKLIDVDNCNADFHLVLENCIQENLISEKIHDGFSSDRIVLYLGEPYIEKWIPQSCFIDLRPYYNKETKELDMDKLMMIVNTMTQEEYDKMINNARTWRKTLTGKYETEQDKLTKLVIEKIKNG